MMRQDGKILTLNAGSSSIKFALFSIARGALCEAPIVRGEIASIAAAPVITLTFGAETTKRPAANAVDLISAWPIALDLIEEALAGASPISIGHRIVHGGLAFTGPAVLDEKAIAQLEALTPLAPGHQPHNLYGVTAARERWPEAIHVGSFDTAFHRTQPRVEQLYALPRALSDEGVIRYGFHGLSYAHIASVAPKILGEQPHARLIAAHLGSGASMCAIRNGESIATTMGFSALDGLPMATRCGAIDPGVVLHLLTRKGMDLKTATECLYKQSGLLGVSGLSGDMRVLEQSDDPHAAEAIELFVHRATREVGSLAAALSGVDALIFTAGVGENSRLIRRKILEASAWLGFRIDDSADGADGPRLTKAGFHPSAWVIPTNEEMTIAREALQATTDA